jgi:hypothetical protein
MATLPPPLVPCIRQAMESAAVQRLARAKISVLAAYRLEELTSKIRSKKMIIIGDYNLEVALVVQWLCKLLLESKPEDDLFRKIGAINESLLNNPQWINEKFNLFNSDHFLIELTEEMEKELEKGLSMVIIIGAFNFLFDYLKAQC